MPKVNSHSVKLLIIKGNFFYFIRMEESYNSFVDKPTLSQSENFSLYFNKNFNHLNFLELRKTDFTGFEFIDSFIY